jgi:hypothetical protein
MTKSAQAFESQEDPSSSSSPLQAFSQWLFQQRGGALHEELTLKLAELTQAVMATDKEGSLTLSIKVAKAGKGIQFIVKDKITSKLPEPDADPSFFFYDEATGSLSRNDPFQPDIPLLDITPKRQPLSEVS